MTASLRILLSKADSNTWERFTRSELKLESVHQESPRSDVFSKRATKPLLKEKDHQKHLTWAKEKNNYTVAQWSKVLFSDESKFCLSESGGRVERHRITLLEVQCEVSTVSDDLGCHAICWCWSTLFSEVHSQQSHCKPCASMSAPPPPPPREDKRPSWNQQELSLAYVTAASKTQHTRWSTPCTDGLIISPPLLIT